MQGSQCTNTNNRPNPADQLLLLFQFIPSVQGGAGGGGGGGGQSHKRHNPKLISFVDVYLLSGIIM